LFADLLQLARALDTIPTNDSNIGPATGVILIDSASYDIRAYYGDSSEWCDVRQVLARMYKKYIRQRFYNPGTGVYDSGFRFFDKPGGRIWTAYLHGDSWVSPFANPPWTLIDAHPGDNRYKRDTVVIRRRVVKRADIGFPRWNYHPWAPGDSILPEAQPYVDNGDFVDSSRAYPTDFYTGAESTNGNQGPRLRPRRLVPGAYLGAVSYVWRLGDTQAPFGLGPALGRLLFPRSRVAPPSPMLAVARSEPFLALETPTEEDYFFTPAWDARLAPLDSAGIAEIVNDTAYASHNLSSLNLEELRRDVILP
jgi:hypothetical protein